MQHALRTVLGLAWVPKQSYCKPDRLLETGKKLQQDAIRMRLALYEDKLFGTRNSPQCTLQAAQQAPRPMNSMSDPTCLIFAPLIMSGCNCACILQAQRM